MSEPRSFEELQRDLEEIITRLERGVFLNCGSAVASARPSERRKPSEGT